MRLSWRAFAIVAPSGREILLLKICKTSKILSVSSPYKILFTLSMFEFIIEFNLVNALGISPNIWLNSLINGGKTKTMNIMKKIVNKSQTIRSANGLEILSIVLTLLQKLQIIFANINEQIINKKKFFKLQKIIMLNPNIDSLRRRGLFNF